MSKKKHSYAPEGVCAKEITFAVEKNSISEVKFHGGCPGNAIGLSSLLEGMDIDDAITRMKGIPCGGKATSCPDQLVKALESIKREPE